MVIETVSFSIQHIWVQIQPLSLVSCVTSGQSLHLFETQFAHQQNGATVVPNSWIYRIA